jgi:hypothetical protein
MAIETLFGPSIADVQELRRQQQEREIAGAGKEFGVFAPLYQASLRFGNQAVQGANTLLGAQDPMLKKATDIQGILTQYQGQDLTDPVVLKKISSDLAGKGYAKESFTIAQDAAKYTQQAKAETRAERALVLSEESAKDTRYKNNPELLLRDALALPEEDPTRTALLTRYSDIVKDKNYSSAKQEADLAKAKADLAKTQAETARIRAITASEETDTQGARVNNNGVRIGKFDKVGRYRSPEGKTYTAKAMETAQAEHDTTSDLIYKLEQVTDDDIKNAFGSATDWTTVPGGGLIANKNTYNAQTKINAIQIQSVLNNLSKLKGPSSDKEMGQMIKDFPGYNAPPDVMRNWMNRATEAANRFLKRSESRYGFDTDYGTEKRFSTEKKPAEKATGTRTRTTRGGVIYTVED